MKKQENLSAPSSFFYRVVLCLVGYLCDGPSVVRLLFVQPFGWAEMARTALCLHAFREVGRDDKDLQPLALGGGVNPLNNKDPKAMMTEADRKVSRFFFVLLFLLHGYYR